MGTHVSHPGTTNMHFVSDLPVKLSPLHRATTKVWNRKLVLTKQHTCSFEHFIPRILKSASKHAVPQTQYNAHFAPADSSSPNVHQSQSTSGMQGNTAIELKLDQCLGSLISQAKRGASGLSGGNLSAGHLHMLAHYTKARVPSWLHLPSLPAFTERARLLSDDDEVSPTPPLSHYARDEALREVAIHGNSAAAHLLITNRSEADSSTPTSTPLVNSPIHPTSLHEHTDSTSRCVHRVSERDQPAVDRSARSSWNGQVSRVANGPVGVLHNSAGGAVISVNGVMSRAAMAMALQRRVRSADNIQDFVESDGTAADQPVTGPQARPLDSTSERAAGGHGADVTGK